MTSSALESKMQRLIVLHHKFKNADYQLTALEIASLEQLVVELHTEVLLTKPATPSVPSKVSNQPVQTIRPTQVITPPASENEEVNSINSEIDEVFDQPAHSPIPPPVAEPAVQEFRAPTPPKPAPKPEPQQPVSEKDSKDIDINSALGINEQIMFANELYSGSKPQLINSIRQIIEKGSKEESLDHFDNVLIPFFEQEQKDAEVVQEFRHFIERLFQE